MSHLDYCSNLVTGLSASAFAPTAIPNVATGGILKMYSKPCRWLPISLRVKVKVPAGSYLRELLFPL